MLPWILAAFISVPIAEIAVFVEVGGRWGLWPTIAAIFATALAGTFLIRQQGLSVLHQVQAEIEAGRFPARQVFDGLCLLIAGALLLTPGFITDGLGFILLVPLTRQAIAAGLLSRLHVQTAGPGYSNGPARDPSRDPSHGHRGDVIDGEFHDLTDSGAEPDGEPDRRLPPPGDAG